jgi:hypothetical protein
MRIFVLAAALGAVALPAGAASAHDWRWGGGYRDHGDREYRQELRECRRELRRADSRREYRRELRECRRELREAERYSYYDRGYDYYRPRYRTYRYQPSYPGRYWDGYRWRYRW